MQRQNRDNSRYVVPFALYVLFVFLNATSVLAQGSPDLSVRNVNTAGVQCGGCPGKVTVEVQNTGGVLSGGYSVQVELRVTPAGDTHNARTYKQTLRGFAATTTQNVTFQGVQIKSCYQVASTFQAKIVVLGGSFREGNTRNNQKSVSLPIRARCPGSSGSSNGSGSSYGSGTGSGNSGSGNTANAPRILQIEDINTSNLERGSVTVKVKNSGSALYTNETVKVELKVGSKSYSQNLRGFAANRTQYVLFRGRLGRLRRAGRAFGRRLQVPERFDAEPAAL